MPAAVAPRLKLTKVTAVNFKCLRDVHFELNSPLAVFVGRNNTGKSTILDIFDFITEGHTDPRKAVSGRGTSLADLQWCFQSDELCTLTLDFEVPAVLRNEALLFLESRKEEALITRFSVEDIRRSSFLSSISYEISFGPTFSETICTNNPANGAVDFPVAKFGDGRLLNVFIWQLNSLWNYDPASSERQFFIEHSTNERWSGSLPKLLLAQHNSQTPAQFAVSWIREFFASTYHSSPHRKSEASQQIQSSSRISTDGSNLVQVLHTLHNNERSTFQRIERDICRLVEGVDSLSTPINASTTTTLINQDVGLENPLPFPIRQVSAGTVQLLILLTQLHTQPQNGLVLLEEMENMLHPKAQAEFARILREMSSRVTLLISTHSPVIASETRENSLFLVKKVRGATQVEPFTEAIADELVDEMGIRPSYSFESNTVAFVEGKFDRAVFAAWLKINGLRATLIDANGYSNVQFYANARILRRQAVRIESFAIFDGDTNEKGDAEQAIRLLGLSNDHVLKLAVPNLESLIADAAAIASAFPQLQQSEEEISAKLDFSSPRTLKRQLGAVLRPVGGYTDQNAAIIASKIEPPDYWLEFFRRVDAAERGA